MAPGGRIHQARAFPTARPGIDAYTLVSNQGFPRHAHDQFGIGVLLSGAQRSWSGRGQVESLPGDVITVNPGEMHDGLPVDGGIRQWRILYFDPALIAAEMQPELAGQVEFTRPSATDPALNALVQRLFSAMTGTASLLASEECLAGIMMRMLGLTDRSTAPATGRARTVARAQARIDDNPAAALTLADMATDLSRYQFLRAFVRQVGATPHAYIVQARVRLARKLLLAGHAIAATAATAGFADQSHMTRAFARQYGITPGRFVAAFA